MQGFTILLLVLLVHTFEAHYDNVGWMRKLEKLQALKREAIVEKIRELNEKLDGKDSEESEGRKPITSNLPVWKRKPDSSDSDCDSSHMKDSSDCESSSSTDEIKSSNLRLHKQSNSKYQKHDSKQAKNEDRAIEHKAKLDNVFQKLEEQFERFLISLIPRVRERIHILEMLKYQRVDPCQPLSPLQIFYKRLYEYNKARYMAWRKELKIRSYILSHMKHMDAEKIMQLCKIPQNIPYALRYAQMKKCINGYISARKIFNIVTKLPPPSLNPASNIMWVCNKTSSVTLTTTKGKISKETKTNGTVTITTMKNTTTEGSTGTAATDNSSITASESKNQTNIAESISDWESIEQTSSNATSMETEEITDSGMSNTSSTADNITEGQTITQNHTEAKSSSNKPSSVTGSKPTGHASTGGLISSSGPTEQTSSGTDSQHKNSTISSERPTIWSSAETATKTTVTAAGHAETTGNSSKQSSVTSSESTHQTSTGGLTSSSGPTGQTSSGTTIQKSNNTHSSEKATAGSNVETATKRTATIVDQPKTISSSNKPLSVTGGETTGHTGTGGLTSSSGATGHTSSGTTVQKSNSTHSDERPIAWSTAETTNKGAAAIADQPKTISSSNKPLSVTGGETTGHTHTGGLTSNSGPTGHTSSGTTIQKSNSTHSSERVTAGSSVETATKRTATIADQPKTISSSNKPLSVTGGETTGHTGTGGLTSSSAPIGQTSSGTTIRKSNSTHSDERPIAWSTAETTNKGAAAIADQPNTISSSNKPLSVTGGETTGHTGTGGLTSSSGPTGQTSSGTTIRKSNSTHSDERPIAWSTAETTNKGAAAIADQPNTISSSNKPLSVPGGETIEHTGTGGLTSSSAPIGQTSSGTIIHNKNSTHSDERPIGWSVTETTNKGAAAIADQPKTISSSNKPLSVTGGETTGHTSTGGLISSSGPTKETSSGTAIQNENSLLSNERPTAWSSAETTPKRTATAEGHIDMTGSNSKPSLVPTSETKGLTSTGKLISSSGPTGETSSGTTTQNRNSILPNEKPIAWSSAKIPPESTPTIAGHTKAISSSSKPSSVTTSENTGPTSTGKLVSSLGPTGKTSSDSTMQDRISSLPIEGPTASKDAKTVTKRPATAKGHIDTTGSSSKPSSVTISESTGPTSTGKLISSSEPTGKTLSETATQNKISPLSMDKPIAWDGADTVTKRIATAGHIDKTGSSSKPSSVTINESTGPKSTGKLISSLEPTGKTLPETATQNKISPLSMDKPIAWDSADTVTKRIATAGHIDTTGSSRKPSSVTISESTGPTSTGKLISSLEPTGKTSSETATQNKISPLSMDKPIAWDSADTVTKRIATAGHIDTTGSSSKPSSVTINESRGPTSTGKLISSLEPTGKTLSETATQNKISPLSMDKPIAWDGAESVTKRIAVAKVHLDTTSSSSKPSSATTSQTTGHVITERLTSSSVPAEHTSSGTTIQNRITTLLSERPTIWSSAEITTKGTATAEGHVDTTSSKPSLVTTSETKGLTSTGKLISTLGSTEKTSSGTTIQNRNSTLSSKIPTAWSSPETSAKGTTTIAGQTKTISSSSKPSSRTTIVTTEPTSTGKLISSLGPTGKTLSETATQNKIGSLSMDKPIAWDSAETVTKRIAIAKVHLDTTSSSSKPSSATTSEAIVQTSTERLTSSSEPTGHMSSGTTIQNKRSILSNEGPTAWSSAETTTKRAHIIVGQPKTISNSSKRSSVTTSESTRHASAGGLISSLGPTGHTSSETTIQNRISPLSTERPTAWTSAEVSVKETTTTAGQTKTISSTSEPSLLKTNETIVQTSIKRSTHKSDPTEHASSGSTDDGAESIALSRKAAASDKIEITAEGQLKAPSSSSEPSLVTASETEKTSTEKSTGHSGLTSEASISFTEGRISKNAGAAIEKTITIEK